MMITSRLFVVCIRLVPCVLTVKCIAGVGQLYLIHSLEPFHDCSNVLN
jgi:hypothetical protein